MPERASNISWLSPRRRRTTGNLKNVPNGQYKLMLDNAEGLVIPARLRSDEGPLPIARRLSQSSGQGGEHSNGRRSLAVEGDSGVEERMTEMDEQEQDTKSLRDEFSNGHFDTAGLEEQLGHITSLLNTLNTRLGQIQSTIAARDKHTAPLQKHLERVDSAAKANVEVLQQLLESQQSTHQAIGCGTQQIDPRPLTDHLASLQDSSITQTGHLKELVEAQTAMREAIEASSGEIDVSPLVEQMEGVQKAIEEQHNPLLEHLEAIRNATERNADQITTLVEAQTKQIETPFKSGGLDLTPMTERLTKIHEALEKSYQQNDCKRPLGAGDPKFILSALTSHLSKIQAVTEENAKSIQSLQAAQSPNQDLQTAMQSSIAATSDAIRSLATTSIDTHRLLAKRSNDVEDKAKENMKSLERRMEATNSQVRELMTGQREMTKVMRDLANAVSAQNKGNCNHVVIPPPRKMGKKVVGFVYEGKVVERPEGSILRQ